MCKGNLQFKSSSISEYCISKQSSKGIKVENTWKDIKCTAEKRVISKKQYCKPRSDYSFVLMTLFAFFCWNHLRNIEKNTKEKGMHFKYLCSIETKVCIHFKKHQTPLDAK